MKSPGKWSVQTLVLAMLPWTCSLAVAAEKDFAELLEFIGEFAAPDEKVGTEWEQLDQAKAEAAEAPAARKAGGINKAADKPGRGLRDRSNQPQTQQGKSPPERKPDN